MVKWENIWLPPYRACSETDKTLVVMTVAHLQSERDLRIIPLRYSKFIFRNIKCLYADQVTTAKQIISRVIVIIISQKTLKIFTSTCLGLSY